MLKGPCMEASSFLLYSCELACRSGYETQQEAPDQREAKLNLPHRMPPLIGACLSLAGTQLNTPIEGCILRKGDATHQMSPVMKDGGGVGNQANLQAAMGRTENPLTSMLMSQRFMA